MARHRSRSASASDARWWLILPANCSNPRAELDSRADPYAIRQWCFRLPPMCPAPSARFNATDDAARISWSATGFSGPPTGDASSIAISAARCAIACAASFGDGVGDVFHGDLRGVHAHLTNRRIQSGQGSPWRFTMPLPRLNSTVVPSSRTPRRSPWDTSATVSGSVSGPRTRNRSRTEAFRALGFPIHRPAVTFGAHRASAPARRPAVA
jgi:hypothetical protein